MNTGIYRAKLTNWIKRFKRLGVKEQQPTAQQSRELKDQQRREERRQLLIEIATEYKMSKIKTRNVEKLRGIPSLYQFQRMMARVHSRAPEGNGFDGADVLANDLTALESFAKSHGVACDPAATNAATTKIIVHAFYGELGLIEQVEGSVATQFDNVGTNLGPIRLSIPGDSDAQLGLHRDELTQVIADSAKLSAAIPRPYLQLEWIKNEQLVLVSIDVAPTRLPYLTSEQDQRLGLMAYDAQARVMAPIADAGYLAPRVSDGLFIKESEPM